MGGADGGGEVGAGGGGCSGVTRVGVRVCVGSSGWGLGCGLGARVQTVGVVFRGVEGVRVCAESTIYDGGGCVGSDFGGEIGAAAVHAYAGVAGGLLGDNLDADVAVDFARGREDELAVVFVQDFALNDGVVADLGRE